MARPRLALDVDDLVRRYTAGQTAKSLANERGVTIKVVTLRLREAGVLLTPSQRMYRTMSHVDRAALGQKISTTKRRLRAERLDEPEIRARHQAGESAYGIAASLGVSNHTVAAVLEGEARDRSAAATHRMRHLDSAARTALTRGAHTIGPLTRQARLSQVGVGEVWMRDRLVAEGREVVQQLAVGPYNIDLAVDGVAVEIHNTTGNPLNSACFLKRADYLADRHWLVVYVCIDRTHPVGEIATQHVLALMQKTGSDPSVCRQHWVIRGNGQLVAVPRAETDNVP